MPKVIISDNSLEFTANTFKTLSKQWDFKHTTSSPHYFKSNGQIERTIQTIKRSIKKALKGNDDPYLAYYLFVHHQAQKTTLHQGHYSSTVQ